jgi:hypothetical protein
MSTFIKKIIEGIDGCRETSSSVSEKDLDAYIKVLKMHSDLIEKTKKMIGDVQSKKESVKILDTVPQTDCHSISSAYVDILNGEYHDVVLCHGIIPGVSDEGKPKYCRHSWIQTRDNSIIEAWPTGALFACPLLYPKSSLRSPFGANLYIPDDSIKDIVEADPDIIKRIRLLKDFILS